MIANWVHVMLVHISVIGTPILVYRVLMHRRVALDSKAWKGTFSGLIILMLISGGAYFTGPGAADWVKQVLVPYPQDQVEEHALWGRMAMVIQGIAGLLGIMGWSSILQEEVPDRRIPILLAVLLIANTLVMMYTAHLGGLIRRMDLMY